MDPDDTTYQSEFIGAGHLFQVFVDQESNSGDILIKHYDQNVEEDRYLCVDLDDGAIDFLRPEDYTPTAFVLQIPASQILKKQCSLTEISRTKKVLYKNQESLSHSEKHVTSMFIRPPSKSVNFDQTVFSDILTIKPMNMGRLAVFQIGNVREEVTIQIDDEKVLKESKFEIGKTGFGRKQCGFTYEPQIFNSTLQKHELPVNAGETQVVNTSLAQYTTRATFVSIFQLQMSSGTI